MLFLVLYTVVQLFRYLTVHLWVSSWREECSRCPPGYGVVSVCNETVDTQCSSCPEGFYSNVTSATDRCLVCSKCGQGLFELYPCNATHDVFCELCSWTKAVNNDNYNSKCSRRIDRLEGRRLRQQHPG